MVPLVRASVRQAVGEKDGLMTPLSKNCLVITSYHTDTTLDLISAGITSLCCPVIQTITGGCGLFEAESTNCASSSKEQKANHGKIHGQLAEATGN